VLVCIQYLNYSPNSLKPPFPRRRLIPLLDGDVAEVDGDTDADTVMVRRRSDGDDACCADGDRP
jgi:hypothetical protein